jgi:acyl phosphate:glycerol-3-phosphate acyltransferase
LSESHLPISKEGMEWEKLTIILTVFSYLLGSIMTGYLVSKVVKGKDIRTLGSTNVGARNAGELFGKKVFFMVALGDGLKGLIVVLIGKLLGVSIEMQVFLLLVVLLGHLYPIFLKFHGGKGIATFIGGLLILDLTMFLIFLGVILVTVIISRSATIAVMAAFFLLPLIAFFLQASSTFIVILSIAVIFLLYASRSNMKEKFKRD